MTNPTVPDAQTLRAMAMSALPTPHLVPRLSPLLPDRWPDPAGAFQWLGYAEDTLPASGIATRLQGPVAKITLRLPDGKPQVERIEGDPVAVLGTEYEGLPPPSLDSAEAAWIPVALERSDAGAAKAALTAYLPSIYRDGFLRRDELKLGFARVDVVREDLTLRPQSGEPVPKSVPGEENRSGGASTGNRYIPWNELIRRTFGSEPWSCDDLPRKSVWSGRPARGRLGMRVRPTGWIEKRKTLRRDADKHVRCRENEDFHGVVTGTCRAERVSATGERGKRGL